MLAMIWEPFKGAALTESCLLFFVGRRGGGFIMMYLYMYNNSELSELNDAVDPCSF